LPASEQRRSHRALHAVLRERRARSRDGSVRWCVPGDPGLAHRR
jgi:hypothetical protein